jgi:hypothetical protein
LVDGPLAFSIFPAFGNCSHYVQSSKEGHWGELVAEKKAQLANIRLFCSASNTLL